MNNGKGEAVANAARERRLAGAAWTEDEDALRHYQWLGHHRFCGAARLGGNEAVKCVGKIEVMGPPVHKSTACGLEVS